MKMRQLLWLALGAAAVVLAYAGSPKAAPAPAAPAEKWEYAEIMANPVALRGRWGTDDPPARGGRGIRGGGRGIAPGAGGGPGAVPAQPGVPVQPALPRVRQTMIRWITAAVEIEATSWEDLAEKLKVPPARSGVISAAGHRVRVLNHLGGQGWEMVNGGNSTAWTFKRKVTK